MKQFAFSLQPGDDVAAACAETKQYLSKHHAMSVLVHLYAGLNDKNALSVLMGEIRRELPSAEIVGASSGGEILAGVMTKQTVLVVVDVFSDTKVTVRHFSFHAGEEEETGGIVRDEINGTEDIKAAELLVDAWEISTRKLFHVINQCRQQVKIYGAVPYAHDVKDAKFVFTGEQIDQVTMILITYAGKEFHLSTDYVIGWKPMGAVMSVTKADGKLLYEIDNEPALAVYDKYLKIPNDEHFFENAFEFPFMRYVNDTYMLRMPFFSTEEGAISLVADVDVGDSLYLSYGDVSTILSEVYETRARTERFHPQYIRLYNCATRKTFWKQRINNEISPFERLAETRGFFTGGEILRVNGELVHFNATLLVIGMREGAPDAKAMLHQMDRSDEEPLTQTSMVRRMAHFISVAMQDLLESNAQLKRLATTDELTGVCNRRELSRIITEAHEGGEQFSLVMIDLDDFKQVNDTYGHAMGDKVLQDVGTLIRNSVADIDGAEVGRWGGEEFMVFLPNAYLDAAEKTAERLRLAMVDYHFEKIRQLTISLGVADSETYADMRSIYHDVDKALYTAKKAGKNRVVVATGKEEVA